MNKARIIHIIHKKVYETVTEISVPKIMYFNDKNNGKMLTNRL